MIGSFIFNSTSSESFGLISKSIQRPLLPTRKEDLVEIHGSSGIHDYGTDEYEVRKIIMEVTYREDNYINLRSKARQIAAWLSGGFWAPLIINDEPDKYYLAKVKDDIDLDSFYESGSAEISFICQPFAFSIDETIVTFNATNSTTAFTFTNEGTRLINFKSQPGSKFLITITGEWTNINIKLNGQTISFMESGSSSTLIIDNVDMKVTKDGVNKFHELSGDVDTFLKIIPGNNTIKITSGNINASVKIEFIPLWI